MYLTDKPVSSSTKNTSFFFMTVLSEILVLENIPQRNVSTTLFYGRYNKVSIVCVSLLGSVKIISG